VAKVHPPLRNSYSFIASTSRSIETHLNGHEISKNSSWRKVEDNVTDGQISMARYLQCDMTNPQHQQLIAKLKGLFDQRAADLLLMNWIVSQNLPFNLATSSKFRKFVNSLNPGAIIPLRMTIAKIMHSEYELAIHEEVATILRFFGVKTGELPGPSP
jgi:hypothetical protein